jgi:nitrite reductase (NADH) large subunit
VFIENRYKGLRAPHKLKGAVSGCTRECAEAQSKDFGIIATEKGWNLYVCGNGGSRPQHAKLLVNDVDTDTCVKLIDRFLMFYIRTADPLTRTATWLNKMEGGLDYLRDVIVNDSLGIGESLEKEMKELIATYACEWKEVVENPVLREKFRHFINDEEPDPTLSFVEFRGQKMPQDWNKKE